MRRNADDDGGAGLPNLFWWCDRENGIAGIIATQILPFSGKLSFADLGCLRGIGI